MAADDTRPPAATNGNTGGGEGEVKTLWIGDLVRRKRSPPMTEEIAMARHRIISIALIFFFPHRL